MTRIPKSSLASACLAIAVLASSCKPAEPPAPESPATPAAIPAAAPASGSAAPTAEPAASSTASAPAATPERALLARYEVIRKALAGDSMTGVADAAKGIAADGATLAPALAKAATTVEAAKDIKAAREAFAALSDEAIALRKKSGAKEIHIVFCPMANHAWLQPDMKKVENPYYGASMLECGYEVDEANKPVK